MPIKAENVFFTYSPNSPLEFPALKGVSFEIEDGSFTCIVGKTGCGKSTLIQEFNGLLFPNEGRVTIDEFIVSSNKKERTKKLTPLRKKVGVVFQFSEYQLFEETVEEDVAFGPSNFGQNKENSLKIAHEALTKVNLGEEFYKKSPFDLSGGERRKVSIAGILALEPKILVLDEPTAGLDPKSSREMLELFKLLNEKGTTIILVTHDMNIVLEYASDVIVMDDGKIVSHKKPYELFDEDVDKYSLDTPDIIKVARTLKDKGYKIDYRNIKNISSLINEIKGAKR